MANTVIYQEAWTTKLQERLDHPTTWKEVCRVEYTDTRVLNNPYVGSGGSLSFPAVQSHTRGSAYSFQDFTETNESITISGSAILPIFIDRADEAQSNYAKQMYWAERQGQLLDEKIEAAMLADHASWTNFDNASIGGSAGKITVSAANIDDIIRGIKREINEANGMKLAAQNGIFIIWRPADFEILEAFVQANGFATSDIYLREGARSGIRYMGVDHFVSNDHTAGHLFAGVKKVYHLGICRTTYGQVVVTQDPAGSSGDNLSGIGVVSRIDYAFKAWSNVKPVLFDVLVS